MIEANHLTKKYGPLTAIEEVSFQIGAGEVVGLLGPNGAGKTTTIRLLTGFMPPTSGVVKIAGLDLLEKPRQAKKRIGYLPETPPLYPELTVEESLHFIAGLQGLTHPRSRIEEVLEQTCIADVRRRLVGNLSKGYRQRLGIAQAILHKPDVLIFDEPMNGLDPKQIFELRDQIRTLKKNRAVLLASHILQEVTSLCDRVLIIHQGKIVTDTKIEGVTTQELEELFLHAITP